MTADTARTEALAALLDRRSVSPRRLVPPGLDRAQLDRVLSIATRGPDHGGLHPWRVIEFARAQRPMLAECFAEERQRRDVLATESDLQRAREHAIDPPTLLAFVVTPRARHAVPLPEQWLAAGAALGNLLNAAHLLGFGAIVLSGERCLDAALRAALGLTADEVLAGFVSLGSIGGAPKPVRTLAIDEVWSEWTPVAAGLVAPFQDPSENRSMKTSARNQFAGTVHAVRSGAINDEIDLLVVGGLHLVATVTRESCTELGLHVGAKAFALIKASSIVLMTDLGDVRLSARNRFAGTVARVVRGSVNSEVVMHLADGGELAAIITNESATHLLLAAGSPVLAVFKASSVIIGVHA